MEVKIQIKTYIEHLSEEKRLDLQMLHNETIKALPKCKLWFFDGKNEEGKIVANPTIGYGSQILTYANGNTKEWFRVGVSANKTGISVYILGINDKRYLPTTYGKKIGKASVTGYCIKFKALKDVSLDVLVEAIKDTTT